MTPPPLRAGGPPAVRPDASRMLDWRSFLRARRLRWDEELGRQLSPRAGGLVARWRKRALPLLLDATRDPDFSVRAAAALGLGKGSWAREREAERALRRLFGDPDRRVRECALLALGLGGFDGAGETLRAVARTADGTRVAGLGRAFGTRERAFAIIGLGALTTRLEGAARTRLAGALCDLACRDEGSRSRPLRVAAITALGWARAGTEVLFELARDPERDPLERVHAVAALGPCGVGDRLEELAAFLDDESPRVAASAALALGGLVTRDDLEIVNRLRFHAAYGRHRGLRVEAIWALGATGGRAAQKTLRRIARRGELPDRLIAPLALVRGTRCDARAREETSAFLGSLLQRERAPRGREALATALAALGDEKAVPVLEKQLEAARSPRTKTEIAAARATFGAESVAARLRETARNRGLPGSRWLAARAFLRLRSEAMPALLEELLRVSPIAQAETAMHCARSGGEEVFELFAVVAGDADDPGAPHGAFARAVAVAGVGQMASGRRVSPFRELVLHANYRAQDVVLADLFRLL